MSFKLLKMKGDNQKDCWGKYAIGLGGDIVSTKTKVFQKNMIMFVAKYIFPVFLFLFVTNSYAEITKRRLSALRINRYVRSIVPPEAKTAEALASNARVTV